MLRAMSSVTQIGSRRPPSPPPSDAPASREQFVAGDLVAAMGDRTRDLLGRSDLERRIRLVPRSLMAADLLGLSLAYIVTTLFWGAAGAFGSTRQIVVFCCTLPCWLLVAKLQGLYRADQEQADHSTADDLVKVFHLVTIGVWVLLVASRLGGHTRPSIYALITFWILTICFLPLMRTVTRRLCRLSRAYVQNTLILGAGEVGQLIARKLVKHPEYGLNVVGFIDRDPKSRRGDLPDHLGILGGRARGRVALAAAPVACVPCSD
jgi:FlaA1/EpsC-like NDP-sugar epimerase